MPVRDSKNFHHACAVFSIYRTELPLKNADSSLLIPASIGISVSRPIDLIKLI